MMKLKKKSFFFIFFEWSFKLGQMMSRSIGEHLKKVFIFFSNYLPSNLVS